MRNIYSFGEAYTFYKDIPTILSSAKSLPPSSHPNNNNNNNKGILIAAASRTHAPDLATTLLKQLTIPPDSKRAIEYFDILQIFPGDKKQHFAKIQKASGGVAFEEMLFFDDEMRNRNVEQLGVVMCLVSQGVTVAEVDRGVREWRRRRGVGGKS